MQGACCLVCYSSILFEVLRLCIFIVKASRGLLVMEIGIDFRYGLTKRLIKIAPLSFQGTCSHTISPAIHQLCLRILEAPLSSCCPTQRCSTSVEGPMLITLNFEQLCKSVLRRMYTVG